MKILNKSGVLLLETSANLSDADLRFANLSDANLSDADLRLANLSDANLSDADLRFANLSDANLSDANLSDANLRFANLSDANLSGANLSDANLSDANIRRCVGNSREIRSMQLDRWCIVFTSEQLAIGCKQFSIEAWRNFNIAEIDTFDRDARAWWEKWRSFIFTAIELSFPNDNSNL